MEVKEGYKNTEVGVIPEDWELLGVEKLTAFHKQGYYTQEPYSLNGKYYLLRGTDMQNTYIDLSTTPKINANKNDYEAYKVSVGDFLFVRSGAIGRYGIVKESLPNSIFGSYIINFKFNDNVLPSFFGYFYESQIAKKQIISITQGGGNLNINAENIKALKIPLPPLHEQAAIATVLSDTDNLIQALEKKIAKKELIKKGAMQQLLEPKEGWERKKMSDVCEIRKGQLIRSSTRIDGDIPVIAGGKTPAYYHKYPNRTGKTITISASGANAGYVSFHNYPIFASDCSTISESNNYSIEYIYFILIGMQNSIYKMQTGGAQPHIHPKDINPIIIPFPSISEQIHIAQILSDMDNEIELLQEKLSKYKQLKQGLMQELLTGRIRLV